MVQSSIVPAKRDSPASQTSCSAEYVGETCSAEHQGTGPSGKSTASACGRVHLTVAYPAVSKLRTSYRSNATMDSAKVARTVTRGRICHYVVHRLRAGYGGEHSDSTETLRGQGYLTRVERRRSQPRWPATRPGRQSSAVWWFGGPVHSPPSAEPVRPKTWNRWSDSAARRALESCAAILTSNVINCLSPRRWRASIPTVVGIPGFLARCLRTWALCTGGGMCFEETRSTRWPRSVSETCRPHNAFRPAVWYGTLVCSYGHIETA